MAKRLVATRPTETLDATPVGRRSLIPTARLAGDTGEPEAPVFAATPERQSMRASAGIAIRRWGREANPRAIPGSKLPLSVTALFGMLVAWEFAVTPVLLLEMRADFGFDLSFIAVLDSILGGITLAFSPLTGFAADRVSRVWLMRISAILGTASVFGIAAAHSIALLIPAKIAFSMAVAFGSGASFPLIADWYASGVRARVFGVMGAAARAGGVFGPLLVGAVAGGIGWRGVMTIFGGLWALAAVASFKLREPPRGYMDRLEAGASEEAARREQPPIGWSESWRAARSVVTLRRIWYAMPFIFIGSTGAFLFMQAYFADVFHLGLSQRALIVAMSGVGAVAGSILVAPAMDRLLATRPARVLTLGALLPVIQAILFGVMALSPFAGVSIAAGVLVLSIGAILGVGGYALMSLVTPARVRGLGIQISNVWQLPGLLISPFVIGLAQSWGLRRGMLLFLPLLIAGGIITGSAAGNVEQDIRNARAAAMADEDAERSRREGHNTLLIIRDVDVSYDGTQVLFGVDLTVKAGEIVVLLGTNGAGKSTLLRAIAGLQEASGGAIFVDGKDVTHTPPHINARNGVVMVPGGQAVFPTLSVGENLRTAARASGIENSSARIDEVLEMFPPLRARLRQDAGNLSGGEQQMLAFGQAFLSKPQLMMIDELSLGLAPAIVEQLVGIVRRIHDGGTTVILVEQSINVALTIAERAVFMEKGEVRFDGPVAELMRRADLVRAVFMGGALGGAPSRNSSPPHLTETETETETDLHRTALRAEGITVSFGGVEALRGASIQAAPGEIVGVIGPNGAGKSTLFDVIAGHVIPGSGTVWLEGVEVTSMPPDARGRAGLVRSFQNAQLFGSLTVRECIAVAMERHLRVRGPLTILPFAAPVRRQNARIARRVEALIHLLGLGTTADKFVHELSTGTRRAVDIACIMAAGPTVVLLDEPSSGLAQAESEALAPVLERLARETGCAMLIVEHDLPLVASISDRMVAMDLGAVVATGTPSEVLSDERVVASYLAASEETIQRSDLKAVRTIPAAAKATVKVPVPTVSAGAKTNVKRGV